MPGGAPAGLPDVRKRGHQVTMSDQRAPVCATAALGTLAPAARPLPARYHPGLSVQSRMILSRYSPSVMPSARAATLAERTVRLARLATSSRPGSGRPSGSRTARPSVSSSSRALTTATAVRLDSADISSPLGLVTCFVQHPSSAASGCTICATGAAPGRALPGGGPGPWRTRARTWLVTGPTCDRSGPSAWAFRCRLPCRASARNDGAGAASRRRRPLRTGRRPAGLLGAAQGGEVGVGGRAEGDVTGGRGEAADRSHGPAAIRGNGGARHVSYRARGQYQVFWNLALRD